MKILNLDLKSVNKFAFTQTAANFGANMAGDVICTTRKVIFRK